MVLDPMAVGMCGGVVAFVVAMITFTTVMAWREARRGAENEQ